MRDGYSTKWDFFTKGTIILSMGKKENMRIHKEIDSLKMETKENLILTKRVRNTSNSFWTEEGGKF